MKLIVIAVVVLGSEIFLLVIFQMLDFAGNYQLILYLGVSLGASNMFFVYLA